MSLRALKLPYPVSAASDAPSRVVTALDEAYGAMPGSKKFWFDPSYGVTNDAAVRLRWESKGDRKITLYSRTKGARPTVVAGGLNAYPTLDFTSDAALEFDDPINAALSTTGAWSFLVVAGTNAGQTAGGVIVGSVAGANYNAPADQMFGLMNGTATALYPRVFSMGANTQRVASSAPTLAAWEILTTTFSPIAGEGVRLFRGATQAAQASGDVALLADGRWKLGGRNTVNTGRFRVAHIMGADADWGLPANASKFSALITALRAAMPAIP